MIKKFKQWLIEQFLPAYLKESLLKENKQLRNELEENQIHIRELNAYIAGLELALRSQRRITINNHMRPRASEKPPEEVKA